MKNKKKCRVTKIKGKYLNNNYLNFMLDIQNLCNYYFIKHWKKNKKGLKPIHKTKINR